jgi:hypothetical protein
MGICRGENPLSPLYEGGNWGGLEVGKLWGGHGFYHPVVKRDSVIRDWSVYPIDRTQYGLTGYPDKIGIW